MKNIIVLGSTGMVGNMVFHFLKKNISQNVLGTSHKKKMSSRVFFDVEEFITNHDRAYFAHVPSYIINCIGLTSVDVHNIKNALSINALFPHILAQRYPKSKIISLSTDGVFSGKKGRYSENDVPDATDYYGKTKSLGEGVYPNMLNIRTSIIGMSKSKNTNLMQWLLTNNGVVYGYTDHIWDGCTSLQYAYLVYTIILHNYFDKLRAQSPIYHYHPNKPISKYKLLLLIKEIYNKDIEILPSKHGRINRSMNTQFNNLNLLSKTRNLKKALIEFKNYKVE